MASHTPLPPGVVRAPPLWTLSAEANAAMMATRQRAGARPIERELVTKHVPPWRRVEVAELPSAAAGFARAAERAGLEVAARMAGDGTAQVGIRERERNALWMRATWSRTASGTWTSRKVAVSGVPGVLGVTEVKPMWLV